MQFLGECDLRRYYNSVSSFQIEHVSYFRTCSNSTGTKSWKVLENNAILHSTEKFMKGELDYKMLCTEVITMSFGGAGGLQELSSQESINGASPENMFSITRPTMSQKEVVIAINIWFAWQTQYEYETEKKSPSLITLVSTDVKHWEQLCTTGIQFLHHEHKNVSSLQSYKVNVCITRLHCWQWQGYYAC